MYNAMSLPSTPAIDVVMVTTPLGLGMFCANASITAPIRFSVAATMASRSAIGESGVTDGTGMCPSSPNGASALTMRGSARGSVPMVQLGSARRPYIPRP